MPGKKEIKWTETACLLVIEAVMQVENEIVNKSKTGILRSTPSSRGKWEKINSLLPRELQGRTWNSRLKTHNRFMCARVFDSLLSAYKQLSRKRRKWPTHVVLTKPVLEMLKKREGLLETHISVPDDKTWRSGSSSKVSTSNRSANDQRQPSPSSDSILSLHSNAGRSSEAQEAPDATLLVDSNAEETERNRIDHETSLDGWNAGYDSEDPAIHNKPTSSTFGSPSRSVRDSKDPENMSQTRVQCQARAHARCQERNSDSSTGRPSYLSKASWSESLTTTSMSHPSYDEHLHASSDGLGRIDLEFRRLSSWMQNHFIPVGRKDFSEMITKRRKLDVRRATRPLDKLIYQILSKKIDLDIRASFQKLRVRLAMKLRNTSEDIAHVILQDTRLVYSSPDYSQGITKGEYPTDGRSMSPRML